MKRSAVVLALLAALTLTGCAGTVATAPDEPQDAAATSVEQMPEPSGSPEPLVAEDPTTEPDEEGFLTFVRGRLATFATQIPNATDADLLASGNEACERIRAGEPVEGMRMIEGEKPSEVGGYYYDSNAIVAGAQLHLCKDTIS